MKVCPVTVNQPVKTSFRSAKFVGDIPYKKLLQQGLKDSYGISCKLQDLDSVAGPQEVKYIINNLNPAHYEVGENFRAQFHLHTEASDGVMTVEDYLTQCADWANHIAKKQKHRDNLPPFSASITDHDRMVYDKRVIAEISQNPELYKNFKFISGCEFLFHGYKKPHSAFEAVGLGFNPFDKKLEPMMNGFSSNNHVYDVKTVKEAGGILSWAHPLITPDKLNDDFFSFLKSNGIEGAEGNYQYRGWNKDYIKSLKIQLEELMRKYKFFSTGGTDTHRHTIF